MCVYVYVCVCVCVCMCVCVCVCVRAHQLSSDRNPDLCAGGSLTESEGPEGSTWISRSWACFRHCVKNLKKLLAAAAGM